MAASITHYSEEPSSEDFANVQRFLMASAAAAIMAVSWNFVTTTTSHGAETAATSTTATIGRSGNGGSGGGGGSNGGGGGSPMLKTVYPSDLTEKRAQADVRQWEEDTMNNPYEVRCRHAAFELVL